MTVDIDVKQVSEFYGVDVGLEPLIKGPWTFKEYCDYIGDWGLYIKAILNIGYFKTHFPDLIYDNFLHFRIKGDEANIKGICDAECRFYHRGIPLGKAQSDNKGNVPSKAVVKKEDKNSEDAVPIIRELTIVISNGDADIIGCPDDVVVHLIKA